MGVAPADLESLAARERIARIGRLRRAVTTMARRDAAVTRTFLQENKLTEPMCSALWELDAPHSLTELARRLNCQKQNVTQIADKLEAHGLVQRTTHPTDRRITLLRLTPQGEVQRRRIGEHLVDDYSLSNLTDHELAFLEQLVDRALAGGTDAVYRPEPGSETRSNGAA